MVFSDDGVTGTTMKRPGFQAMIQEIERGNIGAVFVKDLSRLGRNYREVGYYMEEFFPDHDVRLVAVSNGVDTAEGEDAAPTVRRIFRMTLEGQGIGQIATALDKDGILTPMNYWQSKGLNRGGKKNREKPTHWNSSTIYRILSLQEYCGDVISFKTYSKSYKNKRRYVNEEENRATFWGVHEAIIGRGSWEKVQQMRGTRKTKPKKAPERSIFSGMLKCADCGGNLSFHFNQGNHDIKYFNCQNYNNKRGYCNATHYIRLDFLEQAVMQGSTA